jgi:hypothetical protein
LSCDRHSTSLEQTTALAPATIPISLGARRQSHLSNSPQPARLRKAKERDVPQDEMTNLYVFAICLVAGALLTAVRKFEPNPRLAYARRNANFTTLPIANNPEQRFSAPSSNRLNQRPIVRIGLRAIEPS